MNYEYVRARVDKNNRTMNANMESHREIIDRKATAGARCVGWLPITQGPTGKTIEFDSVFEAALHATGRIDRLPS